MSTLFTSVIAIAIFAAMGLIGMSYVNTGAIRPIAQAPAIVATMGNMLEAVQTFKEVNGRAPNSIAELSSEVSLPEMPPMEDPQWDIRYGYVCFTLPSGTETLDAVRMASSKMPGSSAGTLCGIDPLSRSVLQVQM